MEIEKTEDEKIMIKKGVMPVFLSMEEAEELRHFLNKEARRDVIATAVKIRADESNTLKRVVYETDFVDRVLETYANWFEDRVDIDIVARAIDDMIEKTPVEYFMPEENDHDR